MSIFNKSTNESSKEKRLSSLPSELEIQKIINKTYPGIAMYARDVNLNPKLAEVYKLGMIICERGFTDTTNRFMGMVTTHRYVILSNHMKDLSNLEQGTNWGLHVAKPGSHFKILGQKQCGNKTGIFLLHLPDDGDWKLWNKVRFPMDDQVYQMAVQRFELKCTAEVIPELATKSWLDRCSMPLGMDESGRLFDL